MCILYCFCQNMPSFCHIIWKILKKGWKTDVKLGRNLTYSGRNWLMRIPGCQKLSKKYHTAPMTLDEVSRVRTRQVDAQRNLSRMKPLKAYFTIEGQCAPCLSIGNEDHWNSVDNHNRTCERHIGLMKDIISKGKIVDDPSNLELSDQRIPNQRPLLKDTSFPVTRS